MSVETAALLVQEIERRLTLIWLDGEEYLAAVKLIAAKGIVGGAVYDALIAACVRKAGAHVLYTWNTAHFVLLDDELARKVRMP
jgi:predicted nucleic acid-binding protein